MAPDPDSGKKKDPQATGAHMDFEGFLASFSTPPLREDLSQKKASPAPQKTGREEVTILPQSMQAEPLLITPGLEAEEIPIEGIPLLRESPLSIKEVFSLEDILLEMERLNASDLHLSVGAPPCLRIYGDIFALDCPPLDEDLAESILLPLLSQEQLEAFQENGDLDFAYEVPGLARFRVNYYYQYRGMGAAFRLVPSRIPSISELGLPRILQEIVKIKNGLVIVTGPTGSGKSTTLAAMIKEINQARQAHIITIEDPLEFVHQSERCLVTHREIGLHATGFADALRAAIREDPDIIMVGEMRDTETMGLAIQAAEMGLLVMGTLHTNSAARAVDRIIDIFPHDRQDEIRSALGDSLKVVIAQQLVKRTDWEGRFPAVEILIGTKSLANMIREGKTPQIPSLIQTGRDLGMQSLDHALLDLVNRGIVTTESIIDRITDRKIFERAGITFAH